MAFNGNGVFVRLYNWANDKAAGIKVRADRSDAELDGIATGLSTCITKDGQTTVTANLPMATYRHTGVGNASARTDYAAAGQVQDGKLNWVAAGGTADAITATYSPAITALVDGQICFVRAGAANTTTTPTFSPNGLTARTIVKNGAVALVAGDIVGANHELCLRYNLANTRWELLNPAYPFVPTTATAPFADSTSIVKGSADATKLLRIEVDGFTTGTTRVMTPPDENFTVVGLATTQTLTNKSLSDSTTFIIDNSDNTKKAQFQASGITTGTTRTLTIPNASGTLALTSDITANPVKAWVRFDGTDGSIDADSNVTSVTRTGTGKYTINITSATSDANYVVTGMARAQATGAVTATVLEQNYDSAHTTTACYVTTKQGGTFVDTDIVMVAIIGN